MTFEVNLAEVGIRIAGLRGNLSQADFADRLGVDRKTVGTWERGERLLDTKALLGIWAEFDVDPAWLLTGKGFEPTASSDERELLALFRSASLTSKAAAIGALQGAAAAAQAPIKAKKQMSVSIGTNHGQVIEGGQVNTGTFVFGKPGINKP